MTLYWPDHIALVPLFFLLHVFSSRFLVHFVKFCGKHWEALRTKGTLGTLTISLKQLFESAPQSENFLICYKSGYFFYPVT